MLAKEDMASAGSSTAASFAVAYGDGAPAAVLAARWDFMRPRIAPKGLVTGTLAHFAAFSSVALRGRVVVVVVARSASSPEDPTENELSKSDDSIAG